MVRRKNELDIDVVRSLQNDVTNFDEALQLFVRDMKLRNLSRHTIDYYSTKLKKLKKRLEMAEVDVDNLSSITLADIKNHVISFYLNKGNSDASINSEIRAIRGFFNFLYREGYLKKNPVENLKLIREKKKIVQTFSKDQLKELFKQPNLKTFTGLRDFTIMLLLLETGIRAREVSEIRVDDLDLHEGIITINGKNFEQRQVPIQRKTKDQLEVYLKVRGELATDILFVTLDNTPMSKRQIQDQIKKYGNKAALNDVRVSPHTFRHTFAKMCILNGADVFTLQKMLGHNSLEMVRRYVNIFSEDVKNGHKKFSPVEKLF